MKLSIKLPSKELTLKVMFVMSLPYKMHFLFKLIGKSHSSLSIT